MSVVPGSLETDKQPPMTIPLRHFVVALGFLLAGVVVGAADAAGVIGTGLVALAHVHLLLVGWVCVTIMGAMTQFVPVWSGVGLYSRRLASVQLALVTVGLVGFAVALVGGWLRLLPVFGAGMAVGVWVFVYNVGRTLAAVDGLDVTERHFALALAFFGVVVALGLALAADLAHPVFARTPLARPQVVAAHATLAVFGAVLTTVLGALYQLGTMFTQTELHGVDDHLQRLEEVAFPVGVVVLATGRLLDAGVVARVGGVLVVLGVLAMSVVLARRLLETAVPWTPMLSRYAVVAAAMAAWGLAALPAWLADPLAGSARYGAPGTVHLLAVGVVGFVVLGTVYHVVPFIVWVHRYSDRLGFEDVPMIDDLYDDRLAAADFGLLLAGTGGLVLADVASPPAVVASLPAAVVGRVAAVLVVLGALAFVANVLGVVRRHSPHGVADLLVPGLGSARASADQGDAEEE